MINDTPNENDHETNSHHSITDSLHSHDSPHHDHNEDNQLEIEEPRGLGQAISSAFSSIVGALSGKKSRQKSEGYDSEHVEPVLGISPESKKSNEDKPVMDIVMEAMEKEEYAVQEFVPETIVVTETASNENTEEEEEQQHLEVQVQEHPDMIEVEDDNEVLQEQSEDVGVTEITIRYQEIVDENSRMNGGFDEEKVEERQAIVEIQEEERESNEIEPLQQQNNELREGEMENELVIPEENQEQEQDVIIEEKMEEEHQPEPEPEVHREEVVLVQQHDEEKASSHNTEPVAESPNEQPERKGESPVRQEQVIDLAQESHDVPPHEPMLTDMNTVEGEEIAAALDKEDKLQIVGNIIEVSSEEPVLSQERENLEMDSNHPMPVENEKPNESLDRLLQYSPKGLNHTNEDVLLDTSNHSNQQMLIENDENEMQVVPVLEYIEEDHNENDITRIEEPDEIMIEVQDPIEECPESQEMTSILPMMEINTESVIVSALPKPVETKNNHTNTNFNIPKKNEPQKRGIVPPTRISTTRNTSLVDKKPVSEVKTRGIQSAVPKTTITKPKFPPEFASLTAQRKPVVSVKPVKNVQQITPKRDNSSNKSLTTNIVPQRKPLVTQQPNTVNTKKRKAEEVWTKGSDELKQVKKNNYMPTAKEKERVNIFQRNTTTVNTTMKPPQNRTPRVSVDKNSAHNKDGEPSNENEQLSEGQKLSGNKPMCVVCSGIIEARTDSQMLSCLHKIHKRCFLVMEKKKSQCPACNSSTMNRNGFQPQVNTTPGSKRQEKKMVY